MHQRFTSDFQAANRRNTCVFQGLTTVKADVKIWCSCAAGVFRGYLKVKNAFGGRKMEKYSEFAKRMLTAALTAAMLLSLAGCSDNDGDHTEDIDLVGDVSEEATTSAAVSTTIKDIAIVTADPAAENQSVSSRWVHVAPYEKEEWFESFCGKGEYIQGALYFEKTAYSTLNMLLDIKFKDENEVHTYQSEKLPYIYAVTLDDRLLEVDKRDGSFKVLYAAQYGTIDNLEYSSRPGETEGRLLYINDGDHIVQIDRETGEYTVPIGPEYIDNGVSYIYGPGTWLNVDACDYCFYDKDFIIWEDNDENYFYYHPEVDKAEPMVKRNFSVEKADPDWTIGEDVEFSYPPLTGKTGWVMLGCTEESALGYRDYGMEPGYLYFVQGIYEETHYYLLLPIEFKDAPCYLYQDKEYVYGITADDRLLKVDKRDGSYEVLYTAQNGGISSFDFRSERLGTYPTDYEHAYCLIFSDGRDIMKLDTSTDEITVVESSDVDVDYMQCLDWEWIKQYSSDAFDFSYVCQDCAYDPEHFIWVDVNGDWFWYHPDRGESEPLDYNALTLGRNY